MKLTVYDARGNAVRTQEAKSNAKRFSVRCAANQRQLEAMWQKGVVKGTIGEVSFTFNEEGVSSCNFFHGENE